jgi:hypothetical protein
MWLRTNVSLARSSDLRSIRDPRLLQFEVVVSSDTVMLNVQLIDVTPDALVRKHGDGARRIVNVMIGHAIDKGRHDEALELDRVRRIVELKLTPPRIAR